MNKDIVFMCPTIKRADYEYCKFCHIFKEVIIYKSRSAKKVVLADNRIITFVGEKDIPHLRGLHGSKLAIDDILDIMEV